jgi:hypothetical protein
MKIYKFGVNRVRGNPVDKRNFIGKSAFNPCLMIDFERGREREIMGNEMSGKVLISRAYLFPQTMVTIHVQFST